MSTLAPPHGQQPGWVPWPADYAERYRRAGYWTGETLGSTLRIRAATHPDRIAVVDGERRWTYRELDQRADRLAAGLDRLSIQPGDRVVVQLPNSAEFLEVLFALFRLGALPVMALPAHRAAEITHLCRTAEAAAYIITDQANGFDYRPLANTIAQDCPTLRHTVVFGDCTNHPRLTPASSLPTEPVALPDPDPGDLALLQLSGGSGGLPKLIPRTHDDYLYSIRASAEICQLGEDTVYLCALPAAHNFPLSSPGTLGTLYAGGRVVMAPRPSPQEAFALIEREKVTMTGLVPPLALLWTKHAPRTTCDLSSLRVLQVGGAKLTSEAARRITPALGCTLQQVFGMAEGLVNYTRLQDPAETIATTQGRPISQDDEIRIVDDHDHPVPASSSGHLLTRGPYTIRGYYRAPEHNANAFTSDGFYRTGDIVRAAPEGYLVVEGRAKDQLNRGGEKISAEEIENHLLAHSHIHDAAVVAQADDYLGERVFAFVIPASPNDHRLRAPDVLRFLRDRGLATFKLPDRVVFVDAFPTTAVNKLDRRELRALLTQRLAEPAIPTPRSEEP